MNRSIALFIGSVLASMLVIPAINLLADDKPKAEGLSRQEILYNMDFVKTAVAGTLVPAGISIDPTEVIVGKNDWLFLGDMYVETVTDDRRKATAADADFGQQAQAAMASWQSFLAERGVKAFNVLVGPNKGTIYPEHLPDWMAAPETRVLDSYLTNAGATFIDVRNNLRDAKAAFKDPIYYRTDTHWNLLGGGVAFRALAAQVAAKAPDLVWPDAAAFAQTGAQARTGGDLTGFLHRVEATAEIEPTVAVMDTPLHIKRSDWETGEVLYEGPVQTIFMSSRPNLIHTEGALNNRKVLWLRDSFGTALSPYMAATFSDIMQLHWSEGMQPATLQDLVERWKPDYVFVTVVERSARNAMFKAFPPMVPLDAAHPFVPQFQTQFNRMAFVDKENSKDSFSVTGIDPFLIYALPKGADAKAAQLLHIDLTCLDGAATVPLQLFWTTHDEPDFAEVRSAKFIYDPAHPYFPLDGLGLSKALSALENIRVDIDQQGVCARFRLTPPTFGKSAQ